MGEETRLSFPHYFSIYIHLYWLQDRSGVEQPANICQLVTVQQCGFLGSGTNSPDIMRTWKPRDLHDFLDVDINHVIKWRDYHVRMLIEITWYSRGISSSRRHDFNVIVTMLSGRSHQFKFHLFPTFFSITTFDRPWANLHWRLITRVNARGKMFIIYPPDFIDSLYYLLNSGWCVMRLASPCCRAPTSITVNNHLPVKHISFTSRMYTIFMD
jgi:hypothetical protein